MHGDPQTRHPLPPLPDHKPFPDTIPWDTPISELSGWWLESHCECGEGSLYPFRLMAANLGWKRTLRTIVPKLRCKNCGGRPIRVEMVDDAAGNIGRHGAKSNRLVIIGSV